MAGSGATGRTRPVPSSEAEYALVGYDQWHPAPGAKRECGLLRIWHAKRSERGFTQSHHHPNRYNQKTPSLQSEVPFHACPGRPFAPHCLRMPVD